MTIPRSITIKNPVVIFLPGAVLFFLAGFFIARQFTAPDQYLPAQLRSTQKEYSLINPLLLCDTHQQKNLNKDMALEQKMRQFVYERTSNNLADNISVYALNYRTGFWAGVNENDRYDPASMLKVPLMIAYLQASERDPGVLSQQISYTGDDQNSGEYFHSPNDIRTGNFYSVSKLIESMIVNSDNTAAVLLEKNMAPNVLSEIYTDLGLSVPNKGLNVEYISAKSYAYFFRVLYNATYLSRTASQQALELLAQPDFSQGIRAGLPAGTTVAQKFGERSVLAPDHSVQERELHDCGIVYKPNTPYLLCIMSKSKTASFDTLAKNISDLSALVYQEI